MTFYTLANYITEVNAKLNEERNSPNYPDTYIINAINNARRNVWNGTVFNFAMKQFVRPGKVFDWQKSLTYFTSYDVRFLAQDVATIADTSLYTDATGLPATGSVFIRENRIPYTANHTTYLTVSGIAALWKTGIPILFGSPLPGDFAQPIAVYAAEDEKELNIRPRVDLHNKAVEYYRYMTSGFGTSSYNPFNILAWCAIEDGYFTGMYGTEGSVLAMRYQKTYTPLSADSDTDTIPDGIDFIPRLAVADIYLDRGEEARGENYQNKYGVGSVISFYKTQRQKTEETQFGKKIYYGDKSNGSFTNPLYNGPQR